MTKVLVIDDAPAMRSSLSRLLRKEGFEVLAADDGLQAIGYVANRPPDLIILDINMPRMNGIEVLKRLRENMLWRTVPVVGRSSPAIWRKRTLFPDPLGPMITKISPGFTDRLMSFSTD